MDTWPDSQDLALKRLKRLSQAQISDRELALLSCGPGPTLAKDSREIDVEEVADFLVYVYILFAFYINDFAEEIPKDFGSAHLAVFPSFSMPTTWSWSLMIQRSSIA